MADTLTYQELQDKAKSLGLPYVGVSRVDLEKSIAEKEGTAENNSTPNGADQSASQGQENNQSQDNTNQDKPAEENLDPKYNVAFVEGDNTKARKYTKLVHGDNFAQLAETYAAKHKLKVRYEVEKPGIKCPNCGTIVSIS